MSVPATVITNPWLFSNYTSVAGQSPDATPNPTTNNSANVSALIELQSTTQGFLLPRMTTAQRNAMNVVNGFMVYNTTTNTLDSYINGGWVQKSASSIQASGTITAANFIHLNTVPAPLVSAQGANTLLVVENLVLSLVYNTTQYAAGGNIFVQYGNTGNSANVASSTIAATTINAAVSGTMLANGVINGTTGLANTNCVNQPLTLTAATDFTTGDSTVKWWLKYRILTLS